MARRSLRDIFVHKSVEQMHAEHEHGELKGLSAQRIWSFSASAASSAPVFSF